MAIQLFYSDQDIPQRDILINSTIVPYGSFDLNTGPIENLNRVGFLWNNDGSQMQFGTTNTIINNKVSSWFTQEFIDWISQYSCLIVDLITCNLNSDDFIQDINGLKLLYPGITINYSVNLTGTPPYGDWIMESSGENISSIYFNDNIQEFTSVLAWTQSDVSSGTLQVYSRGISGELRATWQNKTTTQTGSGSFTKYTASWRVSGGVWGTAFQTSTVSTDTSYNITGLKNGVLYDVSICAFNSTSATVPTSTFSVIGAMPLTRPTAPTIKNIVPGDTSANVSWSMPDNSGGRIDSFTIHYTKAGGSKQSLLVPFADISNNLSNINKEVKDLSNGFQYTFDVSAGNLFSDISSVSISKLITPLGTPSVVKNQVVYPGDTSANITWTAPDNSGGQIDKYTLTYNGTSVDVSFGQTSKLITGLTNGQLYTFSMSASNTNTDLCGNSFTKTSTLVSKSSTPLGTPSVVKNLVAYPGDTSANITWTAPDLSAGRIDKYTISYSGGSVDVSYGQTSKLITGLTNGQLYTFNMVASNTNTDSSGTTVTTRSSVSASTTTTPGRAPDSPAISIITPLDSALNVFWTGPANNGGFAISKYTIIQVDLSNGNLTTLIDISGSDTSKNISGLVNGHNYSFTINATNIKGTSANSSAVTSKPYGKPNAPILSSLVALDKSINIVWVEPDNSGSPIIKYTISYVDQAGNSSLNGYLDVGYVTGLTSHPILNLQNGINYIISLTATNDRGTSISSNSLITKPYGLPFAPTNVQATSLDTSVNITWTASDPNGSDISDYILYYQGSDLSGSFNIQPSLTSYTVPSLTNGIEYSFYLIGQNARGLSGPSSTVKSTPTGKPYDPVINNLIPNDKSITVNWTKPNTQGSELTSYRFYYTRQSGNDASSGYVDLNVISSPSITTYTIPDLVNGTNYSINMKAFNSNGSSNLSNYLTTTPYGVPNPPLNLSASSGDSNVTIGWAEPDNSGSVITGYTLSYSGNNMTNSIDISYGYTSYLVPNLTNGQTYTFSLTATNARGTSVPSDQIQSMPTGNPNPPYNVGVIPSDGSVTVSWSEPDNAGSIIRAYQVYYVASGISPIVKTVDYPRTTTEITGLTNGIEYSFYVFAINANGYARSAVVKATPSGKPLGTNIIFNVSAGDQIAYISWSNIDSNGSPISSYKIYYDDTHVHITDSNTSSTSIDKLQNGTPYTFSITAINANGESGDLASKTVTPSGIPQGPQSINILPGDKQATVSWSNTDPNGSPITNYLVTCKETISQLDVSSVNVDYSTSNQTFTNLTNGTRYTWIVQAINANGTSTGITANATPSGIPIGPLGIIATPSDKQIDVTWSDANSNGSDISFYTVTCTDLSNSQVIKEINIYSTKTYTFTDLSNGTEYEINVSATNGVGESSGITAHAIPFGKPFVPTSVTAVPFDTYVNISWVASNPNGSDISGYNVYYSNSSLGINEFVQVGRYVTTTDILNLVNGFEYTFIVSAINLAGESNHSSPVYSIPSGKPNPPILLNGIPGDTSANISWSIPDNSGSEILFYTIYKSNIKYQDINATSSEIIGLVNGTEYTFTVSATNANGESEKSNGLNVIPVGLANNLILTLTPGDQEIAVGWSANSNGSYISNYLITWLNTVNNTYQEQNFASIPVKPFKIFDLSNGSNYLVELYVTNGQGTATKSSQTIPFGRPLDINFYAVPGNSIIDLSWNPPTPTSANGSNIEFFRVYYNLTYVDIPANQTSYQLKGLENCGSYSVKLTSTNAAGESLGIQIDNIIPFTIPDQIKDLQVDPSNNNVTLSWTIPKANGSVITEYRIDCSNIRYDISAANLIVDGITNKVSYQITNLTNGLNYTFGVKSMNVAGYSLASNQVDSTPYTIPDQITDLVAVLVNDGFIKLKWLTPNTNGRDLLEYSLTSNGSAFDIYPSDITIIGLYTYYNYIGLVNETTYNLSIQARNSAGYSLESNQISETPKAIPLVITDLTGTAGLQLINLSWSVREINQNLITKYNIIYSGISHEIEESQTQIVNGKVNYTLYYLDPNQIYTIQVQSYNNSGYSLLSNEITLEPKTQTQAITDGLSAFKDNSANNIITLPPSDATPVQVQATITTEQVATITNASGEELSIDVGSGLSGAFVLFSLLDQSQIQTPTLPSADYTAGFYFKVVDENGNSLVSPSTPVTITLTLNTNVQRVDLVEFDGTTNISTVIYAYRIGNNLYQATFTSNSFWYINNNQYIQSGGDPYIRPLNGPQYILPNDLEYVNLLTDETNQLEINGKTSLLSANSFLPVIYANNSYYKSEQIDYLYKYTYYTQLFIRSGDENVIIQADTLRYIKNKRDLKQIQIEEFKPEQGMYSLVHNKHYPLFPTTKGLRITVNGYTITLISDIMTDERHHIKIKTTNNLENCYGGMISKDKIYKLDNIQSTGKSKKLYVWPIEYSV